MKEDRELESSCAFHQFCAEGRCNINYAARIIGVPASDLSKHSDNPVWQRIGYYIAQLCVNVFLLTSVQKIVIGGGIAQNPHLLGYVAQDFDRLINGYVRLPDARVPGRHPIIVPAMKNNLGELYGAVLCADQ